MNIKLSVIVPCYNVAQYLEGFLACLDKQWGEHDHYEVVFVNDGSTDSTPSILAEYVAADTRHRVLINQANQGLSGARNAGMKVARGEWFSFVDPDDFLADGGYAFLMNNFLDDDTDVVSYEHLKVDEAASIDLRQSISGNVLWESSVFEKKDLVLPNVCFCLYRSHILRAHSLQFRKEASFGEDSLFNALLFSKGIRMKKVDSVIYYYVQRSTSISHTDEDAKIRRSIEGLMFCIQEVNKFSGPQYSTAHWVQLFVLNIVSHLMRGSFSVREVRQIRDRLIAIGVFPLTSPWRTERLYFTALAHPWLLPLVRTAVKIRKKLK